MHETGEHQMPMIRIDHDDHKELVRRKTLTGVSLIFQITKLIRNSQKENSNETKETPVLPAIPK